MKILKLLKYAKYIDLFSRLGATLVSAFETGAFHDTETISVNGQTKYLTVILSDQIMVMPAGSVVNSPSA